MATATALPPVAERITQATTLGGLYLAASERAGDVALSIPLAEGYSSLTYEQLGEHARAIARGLIAHGLQAGDAVAILCSTRAEWTLCEAGALCAGAVVVPVYHTSSAEECHHVLSDSEARLVFCESAADAEKVQSIAGSCPHLEEIVTIDGLKEGLVPLSQLRSDGEDVDVEEVHRRVDGVDAEEVATIVYTSGTTGPAKGCLLTHSNLLSATAMIRDELDLDEVQPIIYMFLPLAHVLARVAQMVVLDVGGTLVYWRGDSTRIIEEIAESQPTHFVAVPRVYEKLHAGVREAVESRGPIARVLFDWALGVGRRARAEERAQGRPGRLTAERLRLADRLGLRRVRELFGPRLHFALVGAAPVDPQLLEFFDACGVTVREGYGLTETCAAATLNPTRTPHFGTVGPALPGTEIRIADDGEIQLRGPQVFAGYHHNDAATAATMADGWLRTGDVGSLSADGYLTLRGREKELIITSSGKNVTPVNIENALRESRWVAEAVVYGDGRPYLVCMLVLDADQTPKLAAHLGVHADLGSMAVDAQVRAALQADVDAANTRFARIEQVKRFGVLDHDLTQAAGELTPTLKVKRSVVYKRYAEFFAGLYGERH